MNQTALYVHFPFCLSKCAYCGFYSETFALDIFERYEEKLLTEIGDFFGPKKTPPYTVYIGGGTPSALPPDRMHGFLRKIVEAAGGKGKEFTLEANPDSLRAEHLWAARDAGVTRVSLGAQSLDDAVLRWLGRRHNAAAVRTAVELLRHENFNNFSLDYIFGIPNITIEACREDLANLLSLAPPHLSCYSLTYEEGTPLRHALEERLFAPVSEQLSADLYAMVIQMAELSGLRQYEISNFAREGFECLHNQVYWNGGDYIGCGPAAGSFIGGRRWLNRPSLEAYLGEWPDGAPPCELDDIPPEKRAAELIAMGLRTTAGADMERVTSISHVNAAEEFKEVISNLLEQGFLEKTDRGIKIPRQFFPVADAIMSEFFG